MTTLKWDSLQGLRWCGFEGFDRTPQFVEEGSRISKNVIWTHIGAERALNKGCEKD